MKHILLAIMASLLLMACNNAGQRYESVKGDPLEARIYTLQNGLKVYLTVNKAEPRIQTYIAVRTGSRNDPAESTGLAHYLEHLMFKGTTSFGTLDYERERPLLDSIEALYAYYGTLTDPDQRRLTYHRIDSFSYEASQFAIANEYDKLMAGIGSRGSNAYTSNDVTCYQEDIPSNEVEQWARIQADRFQDMVIRGFHTELEAVYEEYNISLTRDFDKIFKTLNQVLFPSHPYGTQTTIGTQEHLKNPSLQNVWNYYHQWYVPNNVAICMSGDLDPDHTIAVIEKYFGGWQKSDSLPQLSFPEQPVLTQPVEKDVYGPESDCVVLAWRFPGQKDKSYDLMQVVGKVLSNDRAGLFDVNLNQQQKVLESAVFCEGMTDYSEMLALAYPKEGQTLQEARQLMTDQIAKLKAGEWDESLLKAIINNIRHDQLRQQLYNSRRASMFVEAFVAGIEWKDKVEELDRLSRITKEDVVNFANQYLTDGYACIYKHQGVDTEAKKIDKPQISPIETNRDKTSPFVTDVLAMPTEDIQPRFVDFQTDMKVTAMDNGNQLLSKQEPQGQLFNLNLTFLRGSKADNLLQTAVDYLSYLGTKDMTADEYQRKMYELACNVSTRVNEDRTSFILTGLTENMEAALRLFAEHLYTAQPDTTVYQNVVMDELKARQMNKLDQRTCFQRLQAYATYGSLNAQTNIPSAQQLAETEPGELLKHLRELPGIQGRIIYYGPMKEQDVLALVPQVMQLSEKPQKPAPDNFYRKQTVAEPEVLIAPYDAKNIYMEGYSDNGEAYDLNLEPQVELFNEYFGGGMNTIVFQELREARGLAYSASARYATASRLGDTNSFYTYIITQTDKMNDCLSVFDQIVEDMPQSEKAFAIARESILKRLATERTQREDILYYYAACQDLGLDHDPNRDIYERVSQMTLQDLSSFHQQHVKGRTYRYLILGNEADLDMTRLSKMGTVRHLTLQDIFGY